MERFSRLTGLVGDITNLTESKVIVFGVGGVGGHVCESLIRSGVGEITFCDGDVVAESNLNRQIVALYSTIGKNKAAVIKERAEDINPDGKFFAEERFLTPENVESFRLEEYNYIADCIDNVTAKLALAEYAEKKGIKIISCMSCGNKLNPSGFKVADIYDTKICPLCKVIRSQLRKRGVKSLTVVYSEEEPVVKTRTPSSISFVPASAGLLVSSVIIKDLLRINR